MIADGAPLVIEDTQRSPRFARNPHVDSLGVRFYAAAPLRYKRGTVLGALCILDQVPRHMSADDLKVLENMADDLMRSLEGSHGIPMEAPPSPEPAR
ncbi:GAF domain protein [compost metagenome]